MYRLVDNLSFPRAYENFGPQSCVPLPLAPEPDHPDFKKYNYMICKADCPERDRDAECCIGDPQGMAFANGHHVEIKEPCYAGEPSMDCDYLAKIKAQEVIQDNDCPVRDAW